MYMLLILFYNLLLNKPWFVFTYGLSKSSVFFAANGSPELSAQSSYVEEKLDQETWLVPNPIGRLFGQH